MTEFVTENQQEGKPPTYRVDSVAADSAFAAYSELRKLAIAKPHLMENDFYNALVDTAYARFLCLFEVV